MALDTPIVDTEEIDSPPIDEAANRVADRSTLPERPYLTHDEAAAVIRQKKEVRPFDRWRHLPTLEVHYYPRGIEPENQSDYVRYLP